ncbi:MAG: glycosyltransferase [Desulfocapsa sp.]|nr:glycosyltransferase [Desulfocapsa sp.]
MSVPQLSIVIPVYNGGQYLQDTLDSLVVLEETFPCELLFQNCKSIDGTTELLDSFCQGHDNRFHFNEQDSGQSDAINRGTDRATGRWVTWLCADDIILPAVAEAIHEAESSGADLVYGDIVFVEGSSIYPAIGTETHFPGALAQRRLIIQQPGTCILRKAWQEADGVNLDLNWSMDYDLFMRLESKGKNFLRSKLFLAIIRVHPDAKTSSGSIRRLFELWSVIWNSHLRRPAYFRFRPYLVYGSEYLIKALESRPRFRNRYLAKKFLAVLHRLFWRIAGPAEQNVIQQRFHNLSPEVEKLAAGIAGQEAQG